MATGFLFNNGFIIQYGWHQGTGYAAVTTIQYPIAYKTNPKMFLQLVTNSTESSSDRTNSIIPGSVSTSKFQIYSWSALSKFWFSIGV